MRVFCSRIDITLFTGNGTRGKKNFSGCRSPRGIPGENSYLTAGGSNAEDEDKNQNRIRRRGITGTGAPLRVYEYGMQNMGMMQMKKENLIKITWERRDEMITGIKNYFSKERDEEIGDLAAGMMLDFIIENLAPEFYNQGIEDSQKYMQDAALDLLSIQK
jgi:uncharacterized protein (DUF2164 family)